MYNKLHSYINAFNETDDELCVQLVSNADAEAFLAEQIPLLDCPDKELEKIYYFRWWTFRKHIKETKKGHIITEFLPDVPWSGPYNSINCPACLHIREGRWLKDQAQWLKEYIDFWLDGISVENGTFTAAPLIPDSWDYFKVENLWLDGCKYRIVYDKAGTHYGLGSGLLIQKD